MYSINILLIVDILLVGIKVWNILEELFVGDILVKRITYGVAVVELLSIYVWVEVAVIILVKLALPRFVWVDNDVELVRGSLGTTSR